MNRRLLAVTLGALASLVLQLALPAIGWSAEPGQDCDTSLYPLSAPTSRFADHGDGTVTDSRSGLMWLRCSSGQQWSDGACSGEAAALSWPAAQDLARALNAGGGHFYNDWRVPQLQELATLAERQCRNPRINLSVFPGTPAAAYWSTSARDAVATSSAAFVLSFGPEGVAYAAKDERHYVRLVRNGP